MKTEKTIGLIFLVGLIFKIQHWPYRGMILSISLLSIFMIYFLAAFYFFCDKSIKRQNLALSIVSGLFLSLIPLALWCKLNYYNDRFYGIPADQFFLLIGSVSATIILIVIYFLKSKTTENLATYYKNMFSRTIVLTVLSVSFYLIPTVTIIKFQNRHDKEIARLLVLKYNADPDMVYSSANNYPENSYYYYDRLIDEYVQKRDSLKSLDSLKIERDKITK